jgi:hypothetical protein
MAGGPEGRRSFWTTVPGVLTAVATFISAVGGLLLVLSQLGVIGTGGSRENGANGEASPSPTSTGVRPPTESPSPVVPQAPDIQPPAGTRIIDERVRMFTLASGQTQTLKGMEFWTAGPTFETSCASGVVAFSWQVRDPYPVAGVPIEFYKLVPRGGGQKERLAAGSSGQAEMGYCDEIDMVSTSLVAIVVELRHASLVREE